MKPKVWIERIKFSDNSELTFEPNQITVFVGPNNAGKSATLKELNTLTRQKNREGKVVKDFTLKKEGDLNDLLEFVKEFSMEVFTTDPEPSYKGYKYHLYKGHISSY